MLIEQLKEIMPSYEKYLKKKQLSEKTIKQYTLLISKFIEYLDNEYVNAPNNIEYVNKEQVLTFIEQKAKQGASVHNQDTYFKFIKYFFNYLYEKQTMKTLILHDVPGFVVDREQYDREFGYFTIDEMDKIINTAKKIQESQKDYFSYRNYLIIFILTYSGLTLSELYNLEENDIDFDEKKLTIKGVKNGSEARRIHISKYLIEILKEYLAKKNSFTTMLYLFVSRENKRLSLRSIQRSVEEIINESGIEEKGRTFSPRTIRHSTIKIMVENEMELPIISNITGLELRSLYKYIEEFTSVPDIKEELYLEDHPILAK